MIMSEVCPMCCGQTVEKKVTKVISGGGYTATLQVQAEVCLQCGEKLYASDKVRRFEEIKAKLERQELTDLIINSQNKNNLTMSV
jgi:YgiT-type zinc finger domain-containing protein